MTVQVIKQGDQPEWAVIPYKTYLQLIEQAEMLQDIQAYDTARAALERGEDELIPSRVVHAILDGENAVKAWREYRGMSQSDLAEKAGISAPYLSQLENSRRKGSLSILKVIARALDVSLELVVHQPEGPDSVARQVQPHPQ